MRIRVKRSARAQANPPQPSFDQCARLSKPAPVVDAGGLGSRLAILKLVLAAGRLVKVDDARKTAEKRCSLKCPRRAVALRLIRSRTGPDGVP
jgi:hypothetical protein